MDIPTGASPQIRTTRLRTRKVLDNLGGLDDIGAGNQVDVMQSGSICNGARGVSPNMVQRALAPLELD
ncbi:hypothetical protein SCUP234_11249 [Seiridium cupressi]